MAALLVVAPLAWFWWTSLVPAHASVMDMGYEDLGVATTTTHGHGGSDVGGPTVSVADLTGPADGAPDVDVTLTTDRGDVELADGRSVPGYTVNGSSPGPTIDATVGDLVQVTLVNRSVADGVTLHWHGVDVPNAEDGVAGVTQDAVPEGGQHVYRFVVDDAGTYWYHSHQVSHAQVRGGLFGALVVHPVAAADHDVDVVALAHTYGATPTVGGNPGPMRVPADPGATARVRVINTGSGVLRVWVPGASYRLLAVDGRDVNGPGAIDGLAVVVAAGGRADVEVAAPDDGTAVRVRLGSLSVLVGGGDAVDGADPRATLELLDYGTPADVGFDPQAADRRFTYAIGRRPGFVDGLPGLQWTINGHTYPDVPMFMVSEGDVVAMTIRNSSGQPHPMHLHGHHLLVLSRDGHPSRGSPWWVDSLEVENGQTYEVAFVADNPGVWMDHCHNLPHAQQGLVAHVAYTGVTEPFRLGGDSDNDPE